jgi:hypothetical protein
MTAPQKKTCPRPKTGGRLFCTIFRFKLLDDTCNSDQLRDDPRGSVVSHELNTGVHAEYGVQEAADETDGDRQENAQDTCFVARSITISPPFASFSQTVREVYLPLIAA